MTLPKHVTLATPVLGQMDPRCATSFYRTAVALERAGITSNWLTISQNAILAHARNTLAQQFLASSSDRLLFIDADMRFDPEDVLALLERDEDFIGALVATKNPNKRHNASPMNPPALAAEPKETARGIIKQVAFIGTGFLCLTRKVFEDLKKVCPETAYRDHKDGPETHALFDTGVMGGQYVGEDLMFCLRWRKIGGKCWAYQGLNIGHIGTTVYESRDLTL